MITTDLITEITTNGGFTFDPTADKLITVGEASGYAIAVPGTEHVIGTGSISREAFASAVADLVTGEFAEMITVDGCVIGGWYSAERDEYMIEITKIWHVARETAIQLGQSSNQEAIFDLATGEEIPTGGTGDSAASDRLDAHLATYPTTATTWMDDLAPAPAPVDAWHAADNDLAFEIYTISHLIAGDPWHTANDDLAQWLITTGGQV